MKMINKNPGIAFLFFLIATGPIVFRSTARAAVPRRERISLNADWRFQKGDPPGTEGRLAYEKIKDWTTATGDEFVLSSSAKKPTRPIGNLGEDVSYAQHDFDDRSWRQLNLPHDWGIEGPFNQDYPGETGKLPWWGVGWYRKHLTVSASERAKQIYLDIDGAMAYASVWLNGRFVGGWPYGYASFRVDLTPHIKAGGDNVIAIRLDNPPDSSRWYPGGGIYRNVWLTKTSPVHVAQWGTYITTPQVSKESATIAIDTTVQNDSKTDANAKVVTTIYRADNSGRRSGDEVASTDLIEVSVAAGKTATTRTQIKIPDPQRWSIAQPSLYVAVTNVQQDRTPVDTYETTFGIRTIEFTANDGFHLNGEHLQLKGVCDHHDLGA